ncbi:DNA-directed RNA polymerase III subunit RPC [Trema orientale]|uniref:DNA-directed RNA polymerase III subunit RPC n=1 Tax=Trema orientale TaxID=63057 RepID=A0A2P5BWF7_TREOI|nr:DNA-directed RNA polymerase III subunit RPC [Trema orientale]
MKQDGTVSSPRKVRFAPKAPARRKFNSNPPKIELSDEDDDDGASQAQNLLRQFNENLTRRGPKAERKAQVAFGPGASSSSIRSYGVPKDGGTSQSSNLDLKGSDHGQIPLPLTSENSDTVASVRDSTNVSTRIGKKEYREPWDYRHTNYPTILPLRRPYSGDPELLNAVEFGEAATTKEYDEDATNSASELGLLNENAEGNMFCFQLPPILPLVKRSASIKGKEKIGSSTSSQNPSASSKGHKLEELPEGHVGKMLVYKSGAVKLKLGDILYDVSPGTDFVFAQDVVAINTAEKQCCLLGELPKRAVISPDVSSLLDSVIDLG